MKIVALTLIFWGVIVKPCLAQQESSQTPLGVAKSIGDKLIRETSFKYKLTLSKQDSVFNDVQTINFERTFSTNQSAVAFAYTVLKSAKDMVMTLQVAHNGCCTIWLNGKQVYKKTTGVKLQLYFDERSIEMNDSCVLSLKKGINTLLIKSECKDEKGWQVFIQPPPIKGAIVKNEFEYPKIGLRGLTNIDASVANLTNWLMIGPFENESSGIKKLEEDLSSIVQGTIEFGKMYQTENGLVTWTIPKAEVLGDVVNAKEWGTPYNWNYHNGGVAWAMEELSELCGDKKYAGYASNFCDFHILGKPFVEYQVNQLYAFNSANSLLINTPLLDFTLAPSLPYIYKLRKDTTNFVNKPKYISFIDSMMQYALHRQLRLPVSGIYTRVTPVKFTTWADDMFMGIPFLVQASLYSRDSSMRRLFLDDAANQILGFNKEVFDESVNLYSHAHTVGSKIKLPHWSRANGWGIWATTEVLMNLPKNDRRYPVILNHYQKHIAALSKLQDASGFWLNVLDVKESKKEVSGSAIFTMAIARGIRMGWLDTKTYMPVLNKAWKAITTEIENNGTVHSICMGTMCSEDVNYYINRPFFDNDTHGLFAVLFACIEMEKLKEIKEH